MLDYDDEAATYDATRGGQARAETAATALATLLPTTGPVIDIGGGTGIVSAALATPQRPVYVLDASAGMLTKAADRLPGRAIRADATALPLHTGTIPTITSIWLLHLLPARIVDDITTDIARTLAPGGVFVSTVNKNAAHDVGSDLDEILTALRDTIGLPKAASDDHARITTHLETFNMTVTGQTTFTGTGQGRTPATMIKHLTGGRYFAWMPHLTQAATDTAITALAALPGQHQPRPEPQFTLTAWRKHP